MKTKSSSFVTAFLAIVAVIALSFTYFHWSSARAAQTPAVKTSGQAMDPMALKRVAGDGGFSFNTHETPRELPEVSFTDGEGRAMNLSAFKGKVILLNIWATWCGPCRQEMPTLDRLEAKLGGPDFQVVALSIDQGGVPVVKEFYEELGLENLGIYIDDRMRAPAQLGVVGIPGTLLIDREGREIGRKLGPAEWDSEEVLAEIRRHF
jgi:thiol-disulfide isomerase/thioredoxin